MTEYVDRPDELQTGSSAGSGPSNKEQLRAEIASIELQLEHKLHEAKEQVKATAEADRKDIEQARQKLAAIKETAKDGWDNVTEKAAEALLRLLK
jgi:hypothetical protein